MYIINVNVINIDALVLTWDRETRATMFLLQRLSGAVAQKLERQFNCIMESIDLIIKLKNVEMMLAKVKEQSLKKERNKMG